MRSFQHHLRVLTAAGSTRFESSSAAAAGSSATGGGRRRFLPTRFLPKFEIHDVRDNPLEGSMTRVSVDGKQLLLTQYPQMGPRKVDPNDVTPQFDVSRRISTRFRHVDLAAMACVTMGRLATHHVKNNAYDLSFVKTDRGGYAIEGKVHRYGPGGASTEAEDWSVVFEDHFAVALEHFLDASLTESFGFRQYALAQALEGQQSRSTGNNRGQNRNGQNQNRNRQNTRTSDSES
eukprot:gene8698-6118_t